METRANYALIGAFTLAIVAAGFMFVYWVSSPGKTSQPKTYQIIFTGSVSGLSRGSLVLFNGLRVGEVREIDLLQEDPSHVSAIIDVNNRTPVKEDTRARLESQGLTGVASIALAGGSPDAKPLENHPDGSPPVIRAEPSQIQNILQSVENLTTKADALIDKADKLLGDNSASLTGTVKNAEVFTKALADSSPQINSFLAGMGDLGHTVGPLATKLETLSQDVDGLVKAVDPSKVHSVVDNVAAIVDTIAKSDPEIQSFIADAATVARRLGDTAQRVDELVASAGETLHAIDSAKVAASVDGLSRIIASLDQNRGNIEQVLKDAPQLTGKLNTIADSVGIVSATLARNGHNIDQIFADATSFVSGLGATKGRVDGLLASAGDVLKSVDPAKVAAVVDNVQRFAATIDQNRDNIDKVLKDAPQLTAQLNVTAGDVGKVAAALARNEHNIDQIFTDTTSFMSGLGVTKGRLDGVLAGAGDVLKAVEPAKVAAVVDNVQHFAATIDQNRDNIDKVLKDAPKLTADLAAAAENAKSVTGVLARNEPHIDAILSDTASFVSGLGTTKSRLDDLLDSAGAALKAVDSTKIAAIVDNVGRFAGSLDKNRGHIDAIFADTAGFTGRLGGMGNKLDSALNGADGLLGSGEAKGALVQIGEAARSIKKLADNLDGRTQEITAGINRFTGAGFRDLQALATDGRRTLGDLNRTLNGVQRNPQQFLFGKKSAIPEYTSGQ